MKTLLLTLVLSMGLIGSTHATVEVIPACEVGCAGGFGALSAASQVVGVAAVSLFVIAAIQTNDYNCVISKTEPKPGTNHTNEKSTCTK